MAEHSDHLHQPAACEKLLVIRTLSGLSGDMMLSGLSRMLGLGDEELNNMLSALRLSALDNCLHINEVFVNSIQGWRAQVLLPEEHGHRTLADILAIISASGMSGRAKELASRCFILLAQAEAEVHGRKPSEVTFHEVGALDSILDICLSCMLFDRLNPDRLVCSPLPLADGQVRCAHGIMMTPVPAVLKLLNGVPVMPFSGEGETVTPTAIALLKALGAEFGSWPVMVVEQTAIVYGSKTFENSVNGTIFATGHGY